MVEHYYRCWFVTGWDVSYLLKTILERIYTHARTDVAYDLLSVICFNNIMMMSRGALCTVVTWANLCILY